MAAKMETMTIQRLVEMMMGLRSHTFASITIVTPGRLLKGGAPVKGMPGERTPLNPYPDARKLSRQNISINFVYETKLEKELTEKGQTLEDYLNSRSHEGWHQVVTRDDGTLTPLCWHKGRHEENPDAPPEYMWYLPTFVSPVEWIDKDGKTIPESVIEPFKPKKSEPRVSIPYRIVELKNIRTLRVNDKEFLVVV